MAEFRFDYTLNDKHLDAFRCEGIKRLGVVIKKGFETSLSALQMYDTLYDSTGRILGVITQHDIVVGMLVLCEGYDQFRGKKILYVEMCQLDNIEGILDAVEAELSRLAALDDYDVVQFTFTRKGWAKKMKIHPGKGYKVTMYIAEKSYGR